MKKIILISFLFVSLLSFGQVPQRFNKVIVTGDIISPKFIKTGSNEDSVLLGNGSARSVNSMKTDTVSLSNRINTKEPANSNIQSHISSTNNPHSVTKTQVGLGSVDNTSDINKPISSATQTALNGKQPAGAYSTDIHTNITALNAVSGINTGDETLTSIKTKLGAATSVSDGYLKYQDWSIFNSKEPAITKNTAFNKNFGTTPGTVLEGRTFGTAANSAVGDFQPAITGLSTNYIPKWNGSNMVNSLISDDGIAPNVFKSSGDSYYKTTSGTTTTLFGTDATAGFISSNGNLMWYAGNGINNFYKDVNILTTTPSTLPTNGALVVNGGIGANHVRANNFYGNGSNLTGIQLPITLTTNGTSGAATFENGVMNVPNYAVSGFSYGAYSPTVSAIAGVATIGTNTSYYTSIGSIYHVSSLVGLITNVAVNGTCTVQITLPSTPTTSTSISVMGVAGDAVQAYYNGSSSGNTIQITFKSPVASGAGTTVKITADYY